MLLDLIPKNQENKQRDPKIRDYKTPRIERLFEEGTDAVENYEDNARDHSVAGFEPLTMGFVGITRVVAVIHCGLGFGGVTVELYVIESVEVSKDI